MAEIRIDLKEPLIDGMDIKFKAPCDCTDVTNLQIYYPTEDGGIESKSFVFKDAHGNILIKLSNLFAKGAYVKIIVDVPNGVAYLQNADTNGYLEVKMATIEDQLATLMSDDRDQKYLPLSGGTLTGQVTMNGIVLTEGVDYGDELPAPGTPGRLFFRKVSS